MATKRGRNEPCWCGSGKKFKKCHLGREQQKPIDPWEADSDLRNTFSKKFCSAPKSLQHECCGDIIRAHTIPKSASLSKIARNGHVYTIRVSFSDLKKSGGVISPRLTGINKASTFSGFCSCHDKSLFSPIEDKPFTGSQEQCFLLYYRAMSREYYLKICNPRALDITKNTDKGRDIDTQTAIQALVSELSQGTDLALRDFSNMKAYMDDAFEKSQFSRFESFLIELAAPPPVMCSACLLPEKSISGEVLQDLTDQSRVAQMLGVSSFSDGSSGFIVFTWRLTDAPICRRFISDLDALSDYDISNTIIRFLFEYFENICISPDWWDGLSDSQREELIKRINSMNLPWNPRTSNCIQGNNLGFPRLPIVARVKKYIF